MICFRDPTVDDLEAILVIADEQGWFRLFTALPKDRVYDPVTDTLHEKLREDLSTLEPRATGCGSQFPSPTSAPSLPSTPERFFFVGG